MKKGFQEKKHSVGDLVVAFKLYRYNVELATIRHLSSKKVLLGICAVELKLYLHYASSFPKTVFVQS